MIYSPDHKLLVLKNYKVGSTSLEIELSKILPENAIATPIWPEHKDHKPRNYGQYTNHELIKDIDLPYETSIVFVRNPFEQVLSYYYMLLYIMGLDDTSEAVNRYFNDNLSDMWLRSTHDVYTINKEIAVTHILRYERGIEAEMNPILKNLGIQPIKLTTNEKSFNKHKRSYKDVFSSDQLDMIRNEWIWEFTHLYPME
jgi:hypothetical protein